MTHNPMRGIVAIVGGDVRERTIAALAAERYRDVRVFGFPLPEAPIPRVRAATSAIEAARCATALILPLPGMKGLSVFAPQSAEPIVVDRALLSVLRPDARIICGHASPEMATLAQDLGLPLVEYEHDLPGRIARAPAIAEGAIARVIQETEQTIRGSRVAVLGFGVVAAHVAAAHAALGAEVAVFARSAEQRRAADTAGFSSQPLDFCVDNLAKFDLVISAIPAPILTEDVLASIPENCIIFDLASPPGSVDHTAAARLGRKVVWARGLGATSPVSVGRAQWSIIEQLLEE